MNERKFQMRLVLCIKKEIFYLFFPYQSFISVDWTVGGIIKDWNPFTGTDYCVIINVEIVVSLDAMDLIYSFI